jgi:hypothetical protein
MGYLPFWCDQNAQIAGEFGATECLEGPSRFIEPHPSPKTLTVASLAWRSESPDPQRLSHWLAIALSLVLWRFDRFRYTL